MTVLEESSATTTQGVPEHLASGSSLKLDSQQPWPGLDAYQEASSDFFHGRDEEATELLRLIRLAPLTVLYGKSGLGKTSLLQAGLFPLLRAEHYLPIHLRLDFSGGVRESPIEQVMRRLKEELDSAKAEYPAPINDESLWEYLHHKDPEIWSKDNFPLTPVLVFDQFEELFSRSGGNVKLIQQVFDSLADLIENRIPAELASEAAGPKRARLDLLSQRYRTVLSFREDFLPDVRTWEKKVPSLLRNYLRLTPMSRRCAIDAVERAGKAVLDEDVAPWIVDFVGQHDRTTEAADTSDMFIEPVLLSLCCYQLNRRRIGTKIDKNLVEHAGQDILDSFYREALDDPKVKGLPDVAIFIENYLIQGDHFRGDYPRDGALDGNMITEEQLDALTDTHRLLRIVQHTDTARIELIHDRLISVVRKFRDERKTKRQVREVQAEAECPKYDEVHVISEIHMGGPQGFQMLTETVRLSNFIRWVAAQRPGKRVALIFNGDVIDTLAESIPGYIAIAEALSTVHRIMNDPSFERIWEALAHFVSIEGRKLVIIIGNHDIELALPMVQRLILMRVAGENLLAQSRIEFSTMGAGYSCMVGNSRIFCTHGNEVDLWNYVRYESLARVARRLNAGHLFSQREWEPNPGTKMVKEIMNEVKHKYA